MTLNWDLTAPDCVAAQHFLPHLTEFSYNSAGYWANRDGHRVPAAHVTRAIRAIPAPEGPYWDRVRHRQTTEWGSSTLRRHVENYLFAWSYGNRCNCLQNPCKYTGSQSLWVKS